MEINVYDSIIIEAWNLDGKAINQWKLNDNTSTSYVTDNIGANNGTFQNGNTEDISIPSIMNKSFNFRSFDIVVDDDNIPITDDNLEIVVTDTEPDYVEFNALDYPWNQKHAISIWIKFDELSGRRENVFYYGNGWYVNDMLTIFKSSDDLLSIDVMKGSSNQISYTFSTIEVNKWYHIVINYELNNFEIWINNTRVLLDVDVDYFENIGSLMLLGRAYSEDEYLNGQIDNLIIFNDVLTQTEINYLYNFGNGVEDLSPESYIHISLDKLNADNFDDIDLIEYFNIELFSILFNVYESINIDEYFYNYLDVLNISVLDLINILEYNIFVSSFWQLWIYVFDVLPRQRIFDINLDRFIEERTFEVMPRKRIFTINRNLIFEKNTCMRIFKSKNPKLRG